MASSAFSGGDPDRDGTGGDAPAADLAGRRRAAPFPTGAAISAADRDALKAALARLPRHERRAVVLRFIGGRSPDQIAASMRVPREDVGRLLERSLARLRSDLRA